MPETAETHLNGGHATEETQDKKETKRNHYVASFSL